MAPRRSNKSDFNRKRLNEGWIRIAELDDFQKFSNFVNYSGDANHKRFGPYAMAQVKKFFLEVDKEANSGGAKPGSLAIFLDESKSQFFVSLSRSTDDLVFVWSCQKPQEEQGDPIVPLDGPGCLTKLGVLAVGDKSARLPFPAQEDKAFMWKAPSFHPLQVLENVYQRVVRKAGQDADSDPIQAQSDTLSQYFIQDPGKPESFRSRSLDMFDGEHLASVKMNHLIDSFYLFRLLVLYRAESDVPIDEDLRAELSGNLTKLLHNGDKTKMGWLSEWLTKKIAELGAMTNALNKDGKKRAIFFLKGGRALNYFLGTPEKGENDWDTQVVINPSLTAEEWYKCLADVHDVLLVALKTFKTEFTTLVQKNSPRFTEYLAAAAPKAVEDEEEDENEAGDVKSLLEHANCKAELIDIGIPRRDSPSALEEWAHLSGGHLLETDGVIYPDREYYLNEYLMMVRDVFVTYEMRKAPKRIARLGLILKNNRGREQGAYSTGKKGLAALPDTASMVAALGDEGKQELLGLIVSQFVEAYNLHEDKGLATYFDKKCLAMISNPPALPQELADLLDDGQKQTATLVRIAHNLSVDMDKHWAIRNQFFEDRLPFFADFVRQLSRTTNSDLRKIRAQFAVAGSYAARLHADHLRITPVGLEPIRRILIKLQCSQGRSRAEVMDTAREHIKTAAQGTEKLTVTEVTDPGKHSLLLFWNEEVTIGDFKYAPLVMKVRVAEQSGMQLPVLSSIYGIPVLDPRYLVADYLKKASKIDERGSRKVLASATAAVSEMLSRFDFDSDDVG